jgi:hypothetical protein
MLLAGCQRVVLSQPSVSQMLMVEAGVISVKEVLGPIASIADGCFMYAENAGQQVALMLKQVDQ